MHSDLSVIDSFNVLQQPLVAVHMQKYDTFHGAKPD